MSRKPPPPSLLKHRCFDDENIADWINLELIKKNLCGKVSYFNSINIVYPYIINCLHLKLKAYNNAYDTDACENVVQQLCDVIKFYNMFAANDKIDEMLMIFKDDEYEYSLLLSVLNCDKLWPDVKINFTDAINNLKNETLKQTLINAGDPDTDIVSVLGQYNNFKAGILYGDNKIDAGRLYDELLTTVTYMLRIKDVSRAFIGRDHGIQYYYNNDDTSLQLISDSPSPSPSPSSSPSPSVDSFSRSSSVDSSSRSSSPSPSVDSSSRPPSARPPSVRSPPLDYMNNEEENRVIKSNVKPKPQGKTMKLPPFNFGKNQIHHKGGKKSRRKPKKKKRTIRRRTRQ